MIIGGVPLLLYVVLYLMTMLKNDLGMERRAVDSFLARSEGNRVIGGTVAHIGDEEGAAAAVVHAGRALDPRPDPVGRHR